jgi:hypothetical protein
VAIPHFCPYATPIGARAVTVRSSKMKPDSSARRTGQVSATRSSLFCRSGVTLVGAAEALWLVGNDLLPAVGVDFVLEAIAPAGRAVAVMAISTSAVRACWSPGTSAVDY